MINREILEAQKELLAHTFSQAQAYTNIILVAGYAGFFAIWSFIRQDLSKQQIFWSGLMISISLAVFIAWETYGMFFRSRSVMGIAKAVNDPPNFERLLLTHQKNEHERIIRFGRVWIVVLVVVVGTGFSAIGMMLWAFIQGLWRFYCSP